MYEVICLEIDATERVALKDVKSLEAAEEHVTYLNTTLELYPPALPYYYYKKQCKLFPITSSEAMHK